ncbi:pilin [Clostridium baratii]|uniref:Uncharacterized protein n=1 Tax=Clostridium baratii TaxID=1561 RepID=A0A174V9I3_9CLOT|nr:pilin [Clostridium baratii]CUQ30166.1 Uncharacterised protein [Clostridium baratii]
MDVFQQLISMSNDFLHQLQLLAGAVCALCLGVGGFKFMTGGPEGQRNSKPWFIGSVVGFLVVLGAGAFSAYIRSKSQF